MAKYDWKQLEKEYILSDHKSVSGFLKDKGIKTSGSTKKNTKGWKEKKGLKEYQKSTKIIEKVIEKESEKEAQKILQVKDVANELLIKIAQANGELNKHIARSKKRTKTIEYDYKIGKIKKETTDDEEKVESYIDIIDRLGLKQLTSALKDLNDILNPQSDVEEPDDDEKVQIINDLPKD